MNYVVLLHDFETEILFRSSLQTLSLSADPIKSHTQPSYSVSVSIKKSNICHSHFPSCTILNLQRICISYSIHVLFNFNY